MENTRTITFRGREKSVIYQAQKRTNVVDHGYIRIELLKRTIFMVRNTYLSYGRLLSHKLVVLVVDGH